MVQAQAFGGLNDTAGTPMALDSMFGIYSMTKPLASKTLMMPVEDGLTDPVSKFLPSFKNPMASIGSCAPVFNRIAYKLVPADREPKIQNLLRHTSGIAYGELTRNALVREAYIKAGFRFYKSTVDYDACDLPGAEMADRLGKAPLAQQPGTAREHSLSVDVQGRVVEAASGPRLGSGYTFGLGFLVRQGDGIAAVAGSAGEFMWAGAAGTFIWAEPKEQRCAVYMTQAPSPLRASYRRAMKNPVAQAPVD